MIFLSSTHTIVCLYLWIFGHVASAEQAAGHSRPIQFCKQDEALSLDFCVAITPHANTTSSATDVYLTIMRNQASSNDNGWLGIGMGPAMTGALMFVLHDDGWDPLSLVTRVRTAHGHHQPDELSTMELAEGQSLPDIRVIRSSYDDENASASSSDQRSTTSRTGTAHILIYSANVWPGARIEPSSAAQPWIWAHNPTAPILSNTGTMEMHSHSPGAGYGFFWTDFKSALHSASLADDTESPPSFPISNKLTAPHLSTITAPTIYRLGGTVVQSWLFRLHGLLASLAFLAFYPFGAGFLRTPDPRAFNFHWTTQASGSILLVLGAMLGWVLSRRIELLHQFVGIAVVCMVVAQMVLGWRHHLRFLNTRSRSWMSKVHVWMGRVLLVLGWVNVLLGLWARGYSSVTLWATILVIAGEATILLRVLWYRRHSDTPPGLGSWKRTGAAPRSPFTTSTEAGDDHYFELGEEDNGDNDDDEDYDEDGRLKSDVEWEERTNRPKTGEGGREGGDQTPTKDDKHEQATKLRKLDIV